ncbi:MAG: LexA family transcriptional regulator [Desulfobacteraceae bacterium]|nr:LexA family transcriptional regulator [Desulfobacteraceae bacterium]
MKAHEIFKKALLQLMEETQTKQSVLADSLGIKRPHMNAYIKGTRGFSEDKREELASYFGKTYLELLDIGRGLVTKAPRPLVIRTNSGEETELIEQNTAKYRGVPLMESGRLAAWSNGAAFEAYETPSNEVIVYLPELGHRSKHNLMAAKVGGDSMDPLVPENAIVIIDKDDRKFSDNKIFAVALEEGGVQNLAVKRVRKFEEAKGFLLLSENQEYKPRLVVESNWHRLCVGRVIWMWRSFNG